jgi:hypothetical protein
VQIIIFICLFIVLFFVSRTLTRSLSGFLYKFSGSQTFSLHFFHFIFLPGVLVHEFAHLITAEAMLVKTSGLNFDLKKEDDGVVMGSVSIAKTDPIRRALIGFAPVFVGIILISLAVFYFLSELSPFSQIVSYIFLFLIVFEVGNTMYSSPRDLEGTLELLAALSVIVLILYLIGIRIPPEAISFLNSSEVQNLFSKASFSLILTLIIDMVLIAIFKAFQGK